MLNPKIQFYPYKLLVIDDLETVLSSYVIQFRRICTVIPLLTPPSQDALLEAVTRETPDLIITDYRMPGMNGVQVCGWLRQSGYTKPIALISAIPGETFDHLFGCDPATLGITVLCKDGTFKERFQSFFNQFLESKGEPPLELSVKRN